MIRLKSIFIKNYRSIGSEGITIEFPENQPVVIIGENNSGKTNILRAVDVLFGEWNPKYKEFEAWDFFNRSEENIIELKAEIEQFDGMLRESSSTLKRLELKVEKGKQNVLTIINEDGSGDERQANYVREQIASIFIMSERNLAYQLSYANKYTLLSRVTKRFHESLVENKERVEVLKHYYESIIDVFNEVEEFKEFKKMISGSMNNFLSNMSYALGIDFSAYDPSNYYKNLRLVPVENNVVRELEELGTGQQQILAISLAYAYAKAFKSDSSLILIIDEPESHLHPMAQKYVAKVLYEMAKNGLQVIISTHSPYFVDLEYLEGINVVRRENGSTRVKQIRREGLARYCQEHGATKASPDKIVPFYAKSATPSILRGYFPRKWSWWKDLRKNLHCQFI
ncbi:AAA family ATPase [Fervidobacterium pennivorans subsp. carthaginiensis]|uniref:ATP-dependent nuclease n=1 Tax=Fervidobacterium pennivorans TaxID=93466 RepID=UPI00355BC120